MKRLEEQKWHPYKISDIFQNITSGKISNASYFPKTEYGGIEYIGATNRNNGCLYFIDENKITRNILQPGNCIGFIKDGDGSAGFAIYKKEEFASTVNVLYGYSDWINEATGLFFVASQDMIEAKYGHGYKRNLEHLGGDSVMLPSANSKPDYDYMEEYSKEVQNKLLKRYKEYLEKQLEKLEYKEIPELCDKKWKNFLIPNVFSNIKRGKRFKKADHIDGSVPYVSSTENNNGVDSFVKCMKENRIFNNCISLANSGSVGAAFYEPFAFIASDHVTALEMDKGNIYIYLFLTSALVKQRKNFNFNREINDSRIRTLQIMLPVDKEENPDYEYMERYSMNLILKKYKQYISFLEKKKHKEHDDV